MKFGRKPKLTPERIEHVRKLIEEGESRQYVAEMLGVGGVTLYRALSKWHREEIIPDDMDFNNELASIPPSSPCLNTIKGQ